MRDIHLDPVGREPVRGSGVRSLTELDAVEARGMKTQPPVADDDPALIALLDLADDDRRDQPASNQQEGDDR
jgi:hypothetical protein